MGDAVVKARNFCPLADHYTRCPQFRKACDAINCEGNKIVRAILKQREELSRYAKTGPDDAA